MQAGAIAHHGGIEERVMLGLQFFFGVGNALFDGGEFASFVVRELLFCGRNRSDRPFTLAL